MGIKLTDFLSKYEIGTLADLQSAVLKYAQKLPLELVYEAAEYLNPNRETTAAFYTDRIICDYIFKELPDFAGLDHIRVLEPSVGAGNFLPHIAQRYKEKNILEITIVDIDAAELKLAELIFETYYREKYPNVAIRYLCDDYLLFGVQGRKYDLIIGNPPYAQTQDKALGAKYKKKSALKKSSNLFAFFMEKAIGDADNVSLIVPKSLLNAPEYEELRELLKIKHIASIIDFGENGFKGVKIETINLIIDTTSVPGQTRVESVTKQIKLTQEQDYITDEAYPSWLLYRDKEFDEFAATLELGMFSAFRDRQIVNGMVSDTGRYRVLKSRNIGENRIVNMHGYDSYMNDLTGLYVGAYLNKPNIVLIPNLSYSPRACFLPKDTIANGSVALLENKTDIEVTEADLNVFATKEFRRYYQIARNYGTRSLNIDNNSVYFFGIRRKAV